MKADALPAPVLKGVEATVAQAREGPARVRRAYPMGGGCINHALRVEMDPGPAVFVKWNPAPPEGFFQAEVDGLQALERRDGPRIPKPLGHGAVPGGGPAWLVLEFLEEGPAPKDFGARLGRAVAELHRPLRERSWGEAASHRETDEVGWHQDNFIGSLPQTNAAHPDWAAFWQEERLEPQVRRARNGGALSSSEADELRRLLARVDERLDGIPTEGVSLLHGDLWSGNVRVGPQGEPVLLDPAVYRGHREVDLAMADLFGGLPAGFEAACHEVLPVDQGYHEVRRPLYQLYPLLVHVNLFGRGYAAAALRAAREALEG